MKRLAPVFFVLMAACAPLQPTTAAPQPADTSTIPTFSLKPITPPPTYTSLPSPSPTVTPTPAYPDLSIYMSRGRGDWPSPSYALQIDANGNVSYDGWDFVGTYGKRSAKISPQQVDELVTAIRRANLWGMKDMYMHGLGTAKATLSITLNGQIKRIWHSGGCGFYEMALCELEDNIDTIVNSYLWVYRVSNGSAHPTPTPGPTWTPLPPTPTVGPTPTLSPAVMALGDFGIVSQGPCGPPCFLGIRPGVTTIDEAALILKNAGVPCKAEDTQPSWKGLFCVSGDASVIVGTGGLCLDGNGLTVGAISLRPPVKVTVGEFVGQYGPPDSLAIVSGGSNATFAYGSLQTFLFLATQPGSSYTITQDTTLDTIVYLTEFEYPICVQKTEHAEHGLQPWKGYGTYTPNTNP